MKKLYYFKKLLQKLPTQKSILVLGALIELSYLTFSFFQKSEQSILLYIIIYTLSFIFFFIAYQVVKNVAQEKNPLPGTKIPKLFAGNRILLFILAFAVLFRITLLFTIPSTSDDVYRYIWEGKILYNGHNPFELAPDSEKLDYLHTENFPEKVSFKNMTTIYPSAAQLIFTFGYIISGENDTGLKIIYLLFEIVTMLFILKLLALRNANLNLLILYAWLPLPIMEYFINSHIDVVGVTFFIMFLYYIEKDEYLKAALPFVLGVLTKLYPLIIAPLLIKKMGLKKSLIFGLISASLIIILIYPFIPNDRPINASLFTYLSSWSFNGSFYSLFENIFNNGYTARKLTLILFLISVGVISFLYKDFLRATYGVWIAFIAFAATLYPWYLGWIAVVNPFVTLSSVMSLFFTINITNFTPLGEVWREYWWAYLFQYIPFYFLLILELKKIIKR